MQRIALARAVYNERAQLTLLDDVLSAVDAIVERRIWRSLFGPGGLLRGRSVVLVTSAVHHVVEADAVFVEGGRIVQRGAGRHLVAIDGPTRTLYEAFRRRSEAVEQPAKSHSSDQPGKARQTSPSDADEVDLEVADAEVRGSSVLEYLRACSPIFATTGYVAMFSLGGVVAGQLAFSSVRRGSSDRSDRAVVAHQGRSSRRQIPCRVRPARSRLGARLTRAARLTAPDLHRGPWPLFKLHLDANSGAEEPPCSSRPRPARRRSQRPGPALCRQSDVALCAGRHIRDRAGYGLRASEVRWTRGAR